MQARAAAALMLGFATSAAPGGGTCGTYSDDVVYAACNGPRSIAVGDLDGDLDLDVATGNFGTDDASVLLNQCAACPWDCGGDDDGGVGILDFLALLSEWGQAGTPCDLDGGGVGILDFLELLAHWGPCP